MRGIPIHASAGSSGPAPLFAIRQVVVPVVCRMSFGSGSSSFTPGGGIARASPRQAMVPSVRIPHVFESPAANLVNRPAGGLDCPQSSFSQHETDPSVRNPHGDRGGSYTSLEGSCPMTNGLPSYRQTDAGPPEPQNPHVASVWSLGGTVGG